MEPLESAILDWALQEFPELLQPLGAQISNARVKGRDFTGGAGVFVEIELSPGSAPIPAEILGGHRCIDGPEVRSPEFSEGCGSLLWFENGHLATIEIYSYLSEYPADRHPFPFTLIHQKANIINDQS